MANINALNADAVEAMGQTIEVSLYVKRLKEARIRYWIGSKLIALGCRIMGCPFVIDAGNDAEFD